MNSTVKKVLILSAKHAVNALLTNAGLAAMMPKTFNLHHLAAFGEAALSVVIAREAMVWLPVVAKWSQSNLNFGGNGNA